MKLFLRNLFHRKRPAKFSKILEGCESEIDVFRAESEGRGSFVAGLGAEGFQSSVQLNHRRGIAFEIGKGDFLRTRSCEFRDLAVLLE